MINAPMRPRVLLLATTGICVWPVAVVKDDMVDWDIWEETSPALGRLRFCIRKCEFNDLIGVPAAMVEMFESSSASGV